MLSPAPFIIGECHLGDSGGGGVGSRGGEDGGEIGGGDAAVAIGVEASSALIGAGTSPGGRRRSWNRTPLMGFFDLLSCLWEG